MKKFLAVLLVGAVLFAIASCSPTEEVSIDPSPSAAYEKCSVHKKGSTGTHDLDICGQHYMCDGKQHYKATCQNRFACEEGNRERAECGHFACDGSLHEMLECKHYACDGNSHDLDICGQHYAYSGQTHSLGDHQAAGLIPVTRTKNPNSTICRVWIFLF